ncbi:hypothetical protein GCM10020256_05190 [Streptomyces thermocoprophilus]
MAPVTVSPGGDVDGHGLAGEHGRVDGGGALDDGAVGGDLLAGADDEPVAHGQLGHGDAHLVAAAQDGDVLRAEFQQGPQRGARPPLGAGLQIASGQQERGHARGGLQVEGGGARLAGDGELEAVPHAGHARVAEEQRPQGPAERGERAEGDQRVHGGGAVPGVGPGGPVEGEGAPDDDGGR